MAPCQSPCLCSCVVSVAMAMIPLRVSRIPTSVLEFDCQILKAKIRQYVSMKYALHIFSRFLISTSSQNFLVLFNSLLKY